MKTAAAFSLKSLVMAGAMAFAATLPAAVIQVGTGGGTTSPGGWSSGGPDTVDAFTALVADAAKFGTLYDSASGYVGGGTVTGDLYYAFTARSMDRRGDPVYCPTNMSSAVPYDLGTAFAGGQLVGDTPSLNVGEGRGRWAYSFNVGTNGTGSANEFPIRKDPAPARVALFEVHVHYNSSAVDDATVTIWTYDNLAGQRQPVTNDVATSTQTLATASSDFSFNKFQFSSGHADTRPCTRWLFSNVVFAQNAGEAPYYLLTHPVNTYSQSLIQLGTGGGTNTVAACAPATNFVTISALTADPASFGSLYDSASGLVGGGTVSGEVYYAFTARSLDRTGDTCLPAGTTAYTPHNPGNSTAGGQLIGGPGLLLGIGQQFGNWGMGWFTTAICKGGGDFGPRIDAATARVSLFEVRLIFNPSANDTAYVTKYDFDNLPNQRQPTIWDVPDYTRSLAVSGNLSFSQFQFITGHAESATTRWVFSNVVFTRTPGTASLYLLDPPPPPAGTIISLR